MTPIALGRLSEPHLPTPDKTREHCIRHGRHKLGSGSESLSTARRRELNQRSYNSVIGQIRTSPFMAMLRFSAVTDPRCACGTAFADNSSNTFSRSGADTEMTIRDCDSLKRTSVVVVSVEAGSPEVRRTCAPSKPSGLKHHTANATANPPSEQSRALLTKPARMSFRVAFCTAISRSRSTLGTGPVLRP